MIATHRRRGRHLATHTHKAQKTYNRVIRVMSVDKGQKIRQEKSRFNQGSSLPFEAIAS